VNLNTIYILAYQPKQEVGLVGINAYSGEDLQSPNCMFFVPQGKVVDTFDKEMCLFVCSTFHHSASHSKMFKSVQIFIKVEVGDISGTWDSLGQQNKVTRKEKGNKKRNQV
jgi:hypothetical protein